MLGCLLVVLGDSSPLDLGFELVIPLFNLPRHAAVVGMRLEARQHLGHAKRFGDIIDRANFKARTTLSISCFEVRKTIGISLVVASFFNISHTINPFFPGMTISRRITSGWMVAASLIPVSALEAKKIS